MSVFYLLVKIPKTFCFCHAQAHWTFVTTHGCSAFFFILCTSSIFLVFKFISTHKFAYWIGNKLKGPFSRVRGKLIIRHIQMLYSNSFFTTCRYSDRPKPMGVGWFFQEGPRVDFFKGYQKIFRSGQRWWNFIFLFRNQVNNLFLQKLQ